MIWTSEGAIRVIEKSTCTFLPRRYASHTDKEKHKSDILGRTICKGIGKTKRLRLKPKPMRLPFCAIGDTELALL
jgi:hypothetical protein